MVSIHERLKQVREDSGLSQTELTELAGFKSRSNQGSFENGKKDPSWNHMSITVPICDPNMTPAEFFAPVDKWGSDFDRDDVKDEIIEKQGEQIGNLSRIIEKQTEQIEMLKRQLKNRR